ncbi:twin-arginine translocase TatA/TatE family subunit [Streptomyces sp. NPDC048278]|uniref:twin-arginine translocase TatA/TatE family subunit n=1 Tax=Streptomyces sp. NPDC048278 TaxID=3155809 RepID=UPI003444BE23
MFGLSELAVILVVVIVLIGIRKLPELTRSAGRASRIFKSEARAVQEQDSHHPADGSGRVVSGTVVDRDEASPRS